MNMKNILKPYTIKININSLNKNIIAIFLCKNRVKYEFF